jgi:hypothetical protein
MTNREKHLMFKYFMMKGKKYSFLLYIFNYKDCYEFHCSEYIEACYDKKG